MDNTEIITFFPEKVSPNSLVIINYFGFLNNNSQKLYIEYCYDNIENFNTSLVKSEMSKVGDYYFVLVSIENANNLFFRFTNDTGDIDDNSGNFYQKNIESSSEEKYVESNVLLNAYKESNNSCVLQNENNKTSEEHTCDSQSNSSQNMALVPIKETSLSRKGLRFSYRLNKRIKLLLIKLFRKLPSFITGNYRRRINL